MDIAWRQLGLREATGRLVKRWETYLSQYGRDTWQEFEDAEKKWFNF